MFAAGWTRVNLGKKNWGKVPFVLIVHSLLCINAMRPCLSEQLYRINSLDFHALVFGA